MCLYLFDWNSTVAYYNQIFIYISICILIFWYFDISWWRLLICNLHLVLTFCGDHITAIKYSKLKIEIGWVGMGWAGEAGWLGFHLRASFSSALQGGWVVLVHNHWPGYSWWHNYDDMTIWWHNYDDMMIWWHNCEYMMIWWHNCEDMMIWWCACSPCWIVIYYRGFQDSQVEIFSHLDYDYDLDFLITNSSITPDILSPIVL